jgi:hypothetical protein
MAERQDKRLISTATSALFEAFRHPLICDKVMKKRYETN